MGIHWSTPAWMWPLLLVIAAGAVILALVAYDRTVPRPPGRLRRALGVLRSVVFVLLVLAIAGPVLSLLRTGHVPAELLVVVEDSGSMGIRDGANTADGDGPASRWDDALAWGAALDSVFSRLDPPVGLVFFRGNGLEPVREFRLDDPVIPPPAGHGTDLEGLLRQSAERMAGRSVGAVVLFSDGQETRGNFSGRASGQGEVSQVQGTGHTGTGGIGLQVVGVGDPQGSVDRVIKDLRYPDTAYEGDEVEVEFAVDHRFAEGALGSSLQVRLVGNEGVVAETTLPVTGRVVPVSVVFSPAGHGLQVYRLEVSSLDNERFLDNNRASLAIDVRKERSRLLLVTGTPGWDVRFLAQAAASEERIRLDVVYRSLDGLVLADSMVSWSPPDEADGWNTWDGVIISDWGGALTARNWSSLRTAVEGGLGLMVLPGDGSPGQIAPPPPAPPLAGLLPVRVTGWRWVEGPLFPTAVSSRSGHPVLEGLAGPGEWTSGGALAGLPPLRRIVETVVKPEATVLLSGRRREQVQGEDLPLLVVHQPGSGRVAWIGGRNLWELAFWDPSHAGPAQAGSAAGGGDPTGRRLLRNLLVWTAAGEENSGLVFTGRQAFFQEGERIRLAAQWRDMRGRPVLDRRLSLQLSQEDAGPDSGQVRTFALSRTDRNSGYAEVVLPPLPPARYSVQLVGQGDPPVMGRVESLVVSGHSIESTQVRMDRRRLVQVAAQSGGTFHAGAVADSGYRLWDDLLALDWSGEKVDRRSRFDFWSGWPFLALVSVLLGLEWFLRRRNGLL